MASEQTKYQVTVLWIKGHELRAIAAWTGQRLKQVAGQVSRSPWPNRSALTDAERQEALTELRAIRFGDDDDVPLDGGLLDDIEWTILPLTKDQRRG